MTAIFVASDLSARSERAIQRAGYLARALSLPLRVIHVVDDAQPAAMAMTAVQGAEEVLNRFCEHCEALRGLDYSVAVEPGRPVEMVTKLVEEGEAALLVLGSHRNRGIAELVRGTTITGILRGLSVPALIAVGPADTAYDPVVVGWDFSDASLRSARLARQVAPHAKLILQNAYHEPYNAMVHGADGGTGLRSAEREEMEREMAGVGKALGGRVESSVRFGAPAEVVLRAVAKEGATLVAVGRHARSAFLRFMMGETALSLALASPVDVLITPPGAGGA